MKKTNQVLVSGIIRWQNLYYGIFEAQGISFLISKCNDVQKSQLVATIKKSDADIECIYSFIKNNILLVYPCSVKLKECKQLIFYILLMPVCNWHIFF